MGRSLDSPDRKPSSNSGCAFIESFAALLRRGTQGQGRSIVRKQGFTEDSRERCAPDESSPENGLGMGRSIGFIGLFASSERN